MGKDILRFGIQIVHTDAGCMAADSRTDLLLSLLGNPNLHVLAVFFCHDFAGSSGRHQGTGWFARNHIKECKKGPLVVV